MAGYLVRPLCNSSSTPSTILAFAGGHSLVFQRAITHPAARCAGRAYGHEALLRIIEIDHYLCPRPAGRGVGIECTIVTSQPTHILGRDEQIDTNRCSCFR